MNTFFKKSTFAALAVTMAIPMSMSAPTTAEANDAFVGGLVGGVIGGAIGSSAHRGRDVVYVAPRRRVYREPVVVRRGHGNAHINWCYSRYRSYDARTDTFVSYGGRVKYCNSPYN